MGRWTEPGGRRSLPGVVAAFWCHEIQREVIGSVSVGRHPAELFGRRLARRSPRLHGLFTASCGAAGLVLVALVRRGLGHMVILFFAEAFSWAVLACGLWSL